jgi:phage terminase large subunit
VGLLASLNHTLDKYQKNKPPERRDRPIGVQLCLELVSDKTDPKLKESILRRVALLDECARNLQRQKEELFKCKNNILYWVNNWAWTYDPRRSPATIPFDLFPKQAEYVSWLGDRIENKESGLVEKSRDAGLTWLCGAFAIYRWLFMPGSKIAFGSRKESLVDRLGDPDSIFEKFRSLLQSLPDWQLPASYSTGYLKFLNNDNGNSITGEAGDQMGRGGRSSIYFLDEFAFVERAQRVDAAVSQNTDVVIYVSTPNGPGNSFAKKRFSGKYPVFRIHWADDARKDQKWYAKQKAMLDSVVLAQEVDIDYNASIEGVVIPAIWILAAVGLKLYPIDRKRYAGLDVADEGANENVLVIRKGSTVEIIENWHSGNTTQTSHKARQICKSLQVHRLAYDSVGVGAGVGGTLSSFPDLPFELQAINGGSSCSDREWSEFDGHTSKQLFKNLRAELWWLVRRRFEKTWERVNNISDYPDDELISIPNDSELIAQLSQPLYKYTDSGLILIESKANMEKRGIKSPDRADALIYCFSYESRASADWLGMV